MNSVLNPEAPEFYPHLTSFTQDGYVKINNSIKSSNTLPAGSSYGLFKTFTDFNILSNQLSENVLLQTNQIISTELPAAKLKCDEHELNTEKIIDVNDSIIDRINLNIDSASGVNKTSDTFTNEEQTKPNQWNSSPVIAKIQVGSATLIGAKNITRPQINFKDTIDNSVNLWVPKISDKPNNIKPLALNILYNDQGEAVGYEHPYKIELDHYRPPSQFLDPMEPLEYPASLEETMFTYVDTEAKLDALVEHLNTVTELAIDLEHHSYRTYLGITCLIQLTTTEGGDFVIDTLAIREHIHKLNLAFTDPKKLKVLHGAGNDVLWLQRDFGVYLVGMFDTHRAAMALKLSGLSLKHLLLRYCHVNADKKYQLADWRMRPLPAELIEYARMDTHYLLYIWRHLKDDLTEDNHTHDLLDVFEKSRQICCATYNKPVITDTSHIPLYVRSKKSFNSQQMAAMKMLYKWRDAHARVLDESSTYLLPNHMLLALAETLPREVQGVTAVCQPMPPFVKQNLIVIHKMLLSCREMPNEPQLYKMPTSIRDCMNTPQQALSVNNIHDFAHHSDGSESNVINLDLAADLLQGEYNLAEPEIDIFSTSNNDDRPVISELNADAKLFFPPYFRYRKYRAMAQQHELEEFKQKTAKITAISKGNEMIKTEVLVKLQQAQTMIENEEKKHNLEEHGALTNTQQRKRKISAENVEHKVSTDINTDNHTINKEELGESSTKKIDGTTKPLAYTYADFKKFFTKSHKNKQPKNKKKKVKK